MSLRFSRFLAKLSLLISSITPVYFSSSFHKTFSRPAEIRLFINAFLFRFVQIVKDQLRFTYKSTEPSILLQTLNSVFFYCAFFSNYPDLTDKSEHHFLNLKHLRTLQKTQLSAFTLERR